MWITSPALVVLFAIGISLGTGTLRAGALWSIAFKVTDEDGRPLSGAAVSVRFPTNFTAVPGFKTIRGATDERGVFVASDRDDVFAVGIQVNKNGYTNCIMEHELDTNRNPAMLNSTIDIALRKTGTPDVPFSRLVSFTGTDGSRPMAAPIIAKDGNLYGTTGGGGKYGQYGHGTIYKLTPEGALTSLFSFDGTNGHVVEGGVVEGGDCMLYGTTECGGNGYTFDRQGGAGTVFRINKDGTSFTNLHYFTGMGQPIGTLALAGDGRFYGATRWSGTAHEGSVFRVSTQGSFETLLSLDVNTGFWPADGMSVGRDGNLYGTTSVGGNRHGGTLFKLSTNGTFKVIAHFPMEARMHRNKIIESTDGTFYGTTEFGGGSYNVKAGEGDVEWGDGSFYRVTRDGRIAVLAYFNGWNGAHPSGSLIQAKDGSFYGVTHYSGASRENPSAYYTAGTVFRATPNGAVTTVYLFPANGAPNGRFPCDLVADQNCNVYGAAIMGGASGHGTVFKFHP